MHVLLHFIVPAIIAFLFFRNRWKVAYLIMISTMIVDLDHFLADPIYDPARCSIGFHPLHCFLPIGIYFSMCFFRKTRYIGLGLMIHMLLDSLDAYLTSGVWYT